MNCYDCKAKSVCVAAVQPGSVMCLMNRCMCQCCETPCNNGLNCSDCAHEGKTVHDVFLCTGFDGSVKQYVANWKRKQMEKLGGGQE